MSDNVNHPPYYTANASGVECVEVTEHMSFLLGNAVKYVWRRDAKANAVEDLRKALWYVRRARSHGEPRAPLSRRDGSVALDRWLTHEPSPFAREVIELMWIADGVPTRSYALYDRSLAAAEEALAEEITRLGGTP